MPIFCPEGSASEGEMVGYAAEVERLMRRLLDSLKESDRRRYATIEAAKLGHGGVEYISTLLRCDPRTIRQGLSELEGEADLDTGPSLAAWSQGHGRSACSRAAKMLVLSDGGGSNSASRYVFKERSEELADRLGVEIRVAHYPPYCSKSNPIERRLFPHLTRACRGVIFRSLETVRRSMSKAGITTGLEVDVSILAKVYETGRKCAEAFRESMRIVSDEILPRRNCRAVPEAK